MFYEIGLLMQLLTIPDVKCPLQPAQDREPTGCGDGNQGPEECRLPLEPVSMYHRPVWAGDLCQLTRYDLRDER